MNDPAVFFGANQLNNHTASLTIGQFGRGAYFLHNGRR